MPPVFDPAKPYTEEKPVFDPSQPYTEAKGDTPTFDPSKPYTEVKKPTRGEIFRQIEDRSDNDSDEKTALYNALGWLGTSDFSPVVAAGNVLRNAVNLPTNIEKVTGILPPEAAAPMEAGKPSINIPQMKPGTVSSIAQTLGINELAGVGPSENVTGIINGVTSTISGLSTPENLTAVIGTGGGGAPAKVVGTLFAGQMIHGMDEASKRTAEVINNPDATNEERARALTELGAHALMTTALAKHGVSEKPSATPEPTAKDFKLEPITRLRPDQEAAIVFSLDKAPLTAKAVIETANSTADKVAEMAREDSPKPIEITIQPEFKPHEPFTEVPATEAPVSDFTRYNQLVEEIKAIPNTLENFQKKSEIAKEVEAIKNRNGGMPPKEPVSEPVFDPSKPFEEVPPADGELVGMGGAVESEFAPQESVTSIKNASVDADRVKMGLPPRMEPMRQAWGDAYDEAMSKIDADPNYQELLINELKESPRAVDAVETVVLEHRMVDVKNEYDKATRRVSQAYEDGRVDDIPREQGQRDFWANKYQELTDLTGKLGTKAGQNLAARKIALDSDFSLAQMEYEKRASANNGEPLSRKQMEEVTKQYDKIVETNKKFEERVAELEAKNAELEATQAHEKIVKEVEAAPPEYSPQVIKVADAIVGRLKTRADAARIRLREKIWRTSTNPFEVSILKDLAELGAYHLAEKSVTFARWSAKMLSEVGDKFDIKPHLEDLYKSAEKIIEDQEFAGGNPDVTKKAKRVVRGMDATEKKAAITESIKEKLDDKDNDISFLVQKLARAFVESGIKKRDELIDAVHGVLVGIDPEMTRRDAMDAISGYGKFKQLSKDAISVELRDLKGQMQQVAKLEDMQAGSAPSKTGVERRTPSDEERRLLQQVNEMKRKGGFTVTDPAKQLKTALESIKTRLKHQISDLGHQIATGTRIVRDKTKAPEDAEVKVLREQRDALKKDFDAIFGKKGLTDEQRLKLATASVERSIAEYERRIKEKDFVTAESKTKSTPELDAIRSRRDALREEYQGLKELAEGKVKKTPEERAMQSLKTRMTNRTAELEDKLARGDFSTKERRVTDISKDPEAMRLKGDNIRAKKAYQQGLELDRRKNRTTGQKVYDTAKETLNLPRNVLSSWDLSAVLRQGGFVALGNPVRASKAMATMFKSLVSEREAYRLEAELMSRPNAHLYERSKLYLPALSELRLSAKEEAIMSNLGDKIPGVKQSNRAFITFLNQLRADSFDTMVENLAKDGKKPTDAEINAVSNYINIATGRGDLGKAAVAAETLATVFFSPRLMTSRFQLLAGQPFYRGSGRTRLLFAKEYGKMLVGLSAIYGLGLIAGAEIEHDPTSADFGKMKFGNTRVDPLMGLAQNTVLSSKLSVELYKNVLDWVGMEESSQKKFGEATGSSMVFKFLRTKLNPIIGTAFDLVDKKNVVGQRVTPVGEYKDKHGVMERLDEFSKSAAGNLMVPLSFRDVYDVMREHGVAAGTAIEMLSIFGMGVQNYQDKHSQSKADKEELEKYLGKK